MKRKIGRFFSFALVMLVLLSFGAYSSVASAEETGSLTLICKKDDKILDGMTWSVYYVAKRNEKGYTLDGKFKDYPVALKDRSTKTLTEAASTLENFAVLDKIKSDSTGEIGRDGLLSFYGLKSGLYMLCGENFYVGDTVYVPSAVLVEINVEMGKEAIDIMVYPKVTYKVLAETSRTHTVKKVWNDSGMLHPEIQVEIFKNGELHETVVLNDSNKWAYTWDTSTYAEWRIREKVVPPGYTVVYRSSDGQYVIENSFGDDYSEETQPPTGGGLVTTPPQGGGGYVATTAGGGSLPQTGQLWWPVPFMGCGGIVLIVVGLKLRARKLAE